MADDPRRAIFAQWRRVPEPDTSAPVVPPQLRTRRASPSYHYQQQQQSRPLPVAHQAPPLATTAPRSYTQPSTQPLVHSRPVSTQYAVESGRARPSNGYADGTATNPNQSEISRKGPTQSPLNPQRLPPPQRRIETATSSQAQRTRETSERDAYRRQREKQRDLELQLARMMEAHGGSGLDTRASTGATAYRELVSPARPMRPVPLMANDGAFPTDPEVGLGDLGVPSTAFGRGRRVAPSDVMQELDDDFRRSFDEHQRPAADSHSVESAANEDDEEDDGDAFDEEATGERERSANARPTPPPVMEVRVQNPMPPFREEISSDLSSDHAPHAARSPPPSMDSDGNPYVSTHVPTSEDIGVHFPMSSDFDYIPSISMTPPASPSHHHQSTNESAGAAASSREEQREEMDQRRPTKTSGNRVVFSTWSIGFLAGCVAVGFGGLFMEELMQLAGVFLHTSPFTLSRLEQREMSRRLDLLQQELQSFRVAAHEIEQQSQRMVHEVRAHLERMKSERERHQHMISKEMEALRKYVQAVTNELVEDEKHEIRKRLLETITDTVVELPDDLEEDEASGSTRIQSEMPINDSEVEPAVEVVEIALSVAEGTAVSFFEGVEEAEVMDQIQQAVAGVPNAVHEQVVPETVPIGANGDSATTSLVSMELVFLLAGVALIAGIVGVRVRNAHRRKSVFLRRKPPSFLNRFGAKRQPTTTATTTTDESDVETVAFFRGDSDGEVSFSRFSGQSEDDGGSEYSEEQKEGDAEDDYESHGADDESGSLASSGTDFAFEPAEMNGGVSNHSDVESLDESRSSSLDGYPTPARGTPYPRMQQKLKDRLVDESPFTRRSPRIQRRSNLSTMR